MRISQPDGSGPTCAARLSIRDDDYRLSFLQGNFVTLTNMTDEDVDNVIDRCLSPMNVSLHAITPEVRRRIMGKNAARGIEVLEVSGSNVVSVAEHVVMSILLLVRNFVPAHEVRRLRSAQAAM